MTEEEILHAHRPPGRQTLGLLQLIHDHLKPGMAMAEIGVYAGASTRLFAQTLGIYGHIIAVDNWSGVGVPAMDALAEKVFDDWVLKSKQPWCGVAKIRADSLDAVKQINNRCLDLVYVDARHEYEHVLADILAWRPKLKPTGKMSGHDQDLPGVHRALGEIAVSWQIYEDQSWVIREWK